MASSMHILADFKGISAETGATVSGDEHLRQSIRDILMTPLGSRVMRRDYGSRVFELLDAPMTRSLTADLVAATAEALRRWEPRVKLTRVQARAAEAGRLTLDLDLIMSGRPLRLEGVI